MAKKSAKSPKKSPHGKKKLAAAFFKKKSSGKKKTAGRKKSPKAASAIKKKKTVTRVGGEKIPKARNAYNIFYTEQYHRLRGKHPTWAVSDFAKHLGPKWKALSDAQKAPYQRQAEDSKKHSTKLRAKAKAKRKVDHPPSEWVKWSTKRRKEIKASNANLTFGEISKKLGKEWRAMQHDGASSNHHTYDGKKSTWDYDMDDGSDDHEMEYSFNGDDDSDDDSDDMEESNGYKHKVHHILEEEESD